METILQVPCMEMSTRDPNEIQNLAHDPSYLPLFNVPFGVTYEKIGTIQRRLAWPLHKDDTLSQSGRPTGLNIYFSFFLTLLFQDDATLFNRPEVQVADHASVIYV